LRGARQTRRQTLALRAAIAPPRLQHDRARREPASALNLSNFAFRQRRIQGYCFGHATPVTFLAPVSPGRGNSTFDNDYYLSRAPIFHRQNFR
jgi:hypothetical protein